MNVKVTYDDETTDLIDEWEYLRKQYYKKLVEFIKKRPNTSYGKSLCLLDDDPGLIQIDLQIKKLYKLSVPIKIEIVDEQIHKFKGDDHEYYVEQ